MELAEDIPAMHHDEILSHRQSNNAYEESNVADFTISPDELRDTERKIRLKSAIDIRQLFICTKP